MADNQTKTTIRSLLDTMHRMEEEEHQHFLIRLRFRDRVLGALPKSADVMRRWLETRHLPTEEIEAQVATLGSDAAITSDQEAAWTGFRVNDKGEPYLDTYTVAALVREMMSTLGMTVERQGTKQTRQHLTEVAACAADGTLYEGKERARLYFYRNGARVTQPDGAEDSTGHVQTPQGERSIVKKADYIEGAEVCFVLRVPARLAEARAKAVIDETAVARIFAHAPNSGLGKERSMQQGKFDVIQLDQLTANPWTRAKTRATEVSDGEMADAAVPSTKRGPGRPKRAPAPVAEAK